MKALTILLFLTSNICLGNSTVIFERFTESGLEKEYVPGFEKKLSLILIKDLDGIPASISARYFCTYSALFDSLCVVDASSEFGRVASYSLKYAANEIKILDKNID